MIDILKSICNFKMIIHLLLIMLLTKILISIIKLDSQYLSIYIQLNKTQFWIIILYYHYLIIIISQLLILLNYIFFGLFKSIFLLIIKIILPILILKLKKLSIISQKKLNLLDYDELQILKRKIGNRFLINSLNQLMFSDLSDKLLFLINIWILLYFFNNL